MEFKKVSNAELASKIEDFKFNGKVIFTNSFGLDSKCCYEMMLREHTLLYRLPENNYYRLYLVSSDQEELLSILKSLESNYVINIPTKKSIDDWDKVLTESGFEYYTTYSHYLNLTIPTMEKKVTATCAFAKPHELRQVYDLLYRNFPIYAAHLPNEEELTKMIEENRVIADYDENGIVCGVNIFTITGTTAYGNGWVDEGEGGLEIFLNMFNIFIDNGIKRFVFWVRDGNKRVIKMHKLMGANPDGLKDYTYIKIAEK